MKKIIGLVIGGCIFTGIVIGGVFMFLSQDSPRDAGVIDNDNVMSDNSQPADTSQSAKIDVSDLEAFLPNAVNALTDPANMLEDSRTYFYSYTPNLPNIYAVRSLGEVTVKDVKIVNASTHRFYARLYINDSLAGDMQGYWSPEIHQVMISHSHVSDWANARISPSLLNFAKDMAV